MSPKDTIIGFLLISVVCLLLSCSAITKLQEDNNQTDNTATTTHNNDAADTTDSTGSTDHTNSDSTTSTDNNTSDSTDHTNSDSINPTDNANSDSNNSSGNSNSDSVDITIRPDDLDNTPNGTSGFNLIFDYRFDNGYFSDNPDRKAVMDYIETLFESVITSKHTVPKGTQLPMRKNFTESNHTEIVDFSDGLDGYVIFVYAYDGDLRLDDTGQSAPLAARASGTKYKDYRNIGRVDININSTDHLPWFYDPTPATYNDLKSKTNQDAMSAIMHVVGHALGISSPWLEPFLTPGDATSYLFDGPKIRHYNDNNVLPFTTEPSNISSSFSSTRYLMRPQLDRFMMHGSTPIEGFRTLISALDLAILDDLGYTVDYTKVPESIYGNLTTLSNYRASRPVSSLLSSHYNPVGLWIFDAPEASYASIVGYPMQYMPPENQTGLLEELYTNGAITIPPGGYLIINHSLTKTSGYETRRVYSLSMDIKINENPNGDISLFSTEFKSPMTTELSIKTDGRLYMSGTYSNKKIDFSRRNVIVFTLDTTKTTYYKSHIYVNGELYLSNLSHYSTYARYSLPSLESGTPFFTLFGSSSPNTVPIQLFGAGLWDKQLSSEEINEMVK